MPSINGLLAEADPLSSPELEEIEPAGIVLVLDQITDPHNVGAILRTAAGFAVAAVVTTARHSPEATGVLAKSASGALEYVPIVTVQNLARALETLRERGYLLVGLDSTGDVDLGDAALRAPLALVLGAEGKGLRQSDPRHLRPRGAARSARTDQEIQRLERGGAGALCRDQTGELIRKFDCIEIRVIAGLGSVLLELVRTDEAGIATTGQCLKRLTQAATTFPMGS